MAGLTCFNKLQITNYKLEVRGKINRHKYVKVCMKCVVLSKNKVCFRASLSQTARFGALQKKPKGGLQLKILVVFNTKA